MSERIWNTCAQMFGGDTQQEKDLLIAELETEERNPFITTRLREAQVGLLAAYLRLLPQQEFRAMALYYCFGFTEKRIAKAIGRERIHGLLLYCEDRLTQCMQLPRPISKWYWCRACNMALDAYRFQ